MSADTPHRRFNALNGSWVLVSPHRTQRPWQGQTESPAPDNKRPYDEECYLCPGNARSGGEKNPDYRGVYVFTNDFPALLPAAAPAQAGGDQLLRQQAVSGTCRVICYSPRHDLTLATLPAAAIRALVDSWATQYVALGADYSWVQIFENRGEMMGCSNPHPHGQIWAVSSLPDEATREQEQQRSYLERHGSALLDDYLAREASSGERVILDTPHWLLVVPYWATWPFETLLITRDAVASLNQLSGAARDDLAAVLSRLCRGYDALFNAPFPYSMGWHNAPGNDPALAQGAGWRLHAHFFPPLLRSAAVRKFMVGYEMLAEAQRDLTPEAAAEKLRQALATIEDSTP